MSSKVRVGISEYRIARDPAVLVTYGLGSCLGIILYDAQTRLGGLAHTLLPKPLSGVQNARMSKFVETAIRLMLDELLASGAERSRLVAKIIGGANMFEPLHSSSRDGIGIRNARTARQTLEELAIPLVAEDVGGNYGRTLEFDLTTGRVLVRSVRGVNTSLEL